MSKERLSTREIREFLRLSQACGLSARQIAKSCRIARSTVGEYLRRAWEAHLSWPLPEGLDDARIEQLLFPKGGKGSPCRGPITGYSDIVPGRDRGSCVLWWLSGAGLFARLRRRH